MSHKLGEVWNTACLNQCQTTSKQNNMNRLFQITWSSHKNNSKNNISFFVVCVWCLRAKSAAPSRAQNIPSGAWFYERWFPKFAGYSETCLWVWWYTKCWTPKGWEHPEFCEGPGIVNWLLPEWSVFVLVLCNRICSIYIYVYIHINVHIHI